eukprot:1121866-Heterocapsa_arctica.AAC.1
MPEFMAWRPAIPEPQKAKHLGSKGKGNSSRKASDAGEVASLWPKTTKAAAQQGRRAVLLERVHLGRPWRHRYPNCCHRYP